MLNWRNLLASWSNWFWDMIEDTGKVTTVDGLMRSFDPLIRLRTRHIEMTCVWIRIGFFMMNCLRLYLDIPYGFIRLVFLGNIRTNFLRTLISDGLANQLRWDSGIVFLGQDVWSGQKICEIKSIEFSVWQCDWNTSLQLLEKHRVVFSIDHSTKGPEHTVGNQKWCVRRHYYDFDPVLLNWEVYGSISNHSAVITESKVHGTRCFLHATQDIFR